MDDPVRSRSDFVARCMCANCRKVDVHFMRAPNPDPPKISYHGTGEVTEIRDASGRVAARHVDGDVYDRWDERPYEVVRVCRNCGFTWGMGLREAE